MDGNGERSRRAPLPPEIVLTPHLDNESPLPASCQTILHPGSGSGIPSSQQGSGNPLSNFRPPADMNGGGGYGENEAKTDGKYVDPPSYEEAIKYMPYLPSDNTNYLRPHHIDHGQFALSEPYFTPRAYEDPDGDTSFSKSACWKVINLILMVALVMFLLRLVFNRL